MIIISVNSRLYPVRDFLIDFLGVNHLKNLVIKTEKILYMGLSWYSGTSD